MGTDFYIIGSISHCYGITYNDDTNGGSAEKAKTQNSTSASIFPNTNASKIERKSIEAPKEPSFMEKMKELLFGSTDSDLMSWRNMSNQMNVFSNYMNNNLPAATRHEVEQTLTGADGKAIFVNKAGAQSLKDVNGKAITYNEKLGNAFSNIAYAKGEELSKYRDPSKPSCLKGVREQLEKAQLITGGVGCLGGSACDSPDKLMQDPNFKNNYSEVSVANKDLEEFLSHYKGAIVVWPQYNGKPTANYQNGFHKDGHIETILGNDKNGDLIAASDKINKFYNIAKVDPNVRPRIFIPATAN